MSGGIAYVYDPHDEFLARCNLAMVELEKLHDHSDKSDLDLLHELLEQHHHFTASPVAAAILKNWSASLQKFHKVMPTDYKHALAQLAQSSREAAHG